MPGTPTSARPVNSRISGTAGPIAANASAMRRSRMAVSIVSTSPRPKATNIRRAWCSMQINRVSPIPVARKPAARCIGNTCTGYAVDACVIPRTTRSSFAADDPNHIHAVLTSATAPPNVVNHCIVRDNARIRCSAAPSGIEEADETNMQRLRSKKSCESPHCIVKRQCFIVLH
ncbi:protein of unknown function (plasmid) [Cupriavidus neocaledonicus]|uniref:Uncharacterized protein n=1 Tax=Cupriavidus neocaledonicus TaxID=1040979 RepID=A0A375HQZ5_9BURK|nr:hypothetical protein CBM2605_B130456 [Cupriavidus neocaledonicus]SPD59170.1 protein of unknown function [Cupriavidus neocaledonicus]